MKKYRNILINSSEQVFPQNLLPHRSHSIKIQMNNQCPSSAFVNYLVNPAIPPCRSEKSPHPLGLYSRGILLFHNNDKSAPAR